LSWCVNPEARAESMSVVKPHVVQFRSNDTAGTKFGWSSTQAECIGGAVVGAKNEAPSPGRVPHVRPSVHGPKTDSSNAFTPCARILALGRSFSRWQKRWKGCAHLPPPMYARANMGHPSRTKNRSGGMKSARGCWLRSFKVAPEAARGVIVHYPGGLHPGVDDDWADKLETALFELRRDLF
jgi:hypothetical protein